MAISAPHYYCLNELHRRGELPQGGALLEIGEANWYGDIAAPWRNDKQLSPMIPRDAAAAMVRKQSFEIVKELYAQLFNPSKNDAIDYHGTSIAEKRDLNTQLVDRGNNYETVINHGTAEHIFNVANVFRLMHDQCKPGGLMIHESPFTGWIDHGFWNINPTVYFDLAHANAYKMVFMAVNQIEQQSSVEIHSREHLLTMAANGGIPNNSMLYVAMRKTVDAEFKIPMQGVYAGSVSADVTRAWKELR